MRNTRASARSRAGPPRTLLRTALVGALYLGGGALCLGLAIPPGYASAIWPPAGLAFAAVLTFGYRTWPGVLVGSFLANLLFSTTAAGTPLALGARALLSFGIGIGAAMQAVVGAYLVRRLVGYPTPLLRERDILKFIVLGGPAACVVSSTVGVSLLAASGTIPTSSFPVNWFSWWVGDSIGVLLAAPVVLLWIGRPAAPWRNRRAAVAGPLGVTLVVAVVAFVLVERQERGRIELEFERRVADLRAALQGTVDANLEQLETVHGLFDASESVSREEFAAFNVQAVGMRQAFQTLQWAPRVLAADRSVFEAQARAEGLAAFAIVEPDGAGGLRAAGDRPELFPVAMVEQTSPAPATLGIDLGSVPEVRAALDAARHTRSPAVARWTVPGDTPIEDGATVLVVPVYEKGVAHLGGAERANRITGFAVGLFRLADLVEVRAASLELAGLDCEITERGPGSDRVTHLHGSAARVVTEPGAAPLAGGPERTAVVELPGRTWLVTGRATLTFLDAHRSSLPAIVQIAGLLFTGLLGAFLLVLSGRAESIAGLVRERTAELSRANASLTREILERQRSAEALRASEERYRSVLAVMGEGLVAQDRSGRIVTCNGAAVEILGLDADQMMGRTSVDPAWGAIRPDGSPLPGEEHPAMVALKTGRPERGVVMGVHKPDGRLTWLSVNAEPLSHPGEAEPAEVVTTFHDITSLKSAHEAAQSRERQLSSVYENVADGIFLLAVEGEDRYRVLSANPAFLASLGRARHEVEGRLLADLLPEGALAERHARHRQAMAETRTVRWEEVLDRPGGTSHGEATITPIFDDRGACTSLVGTLHDLTSRKREEEERLRLEARVQEAQKLESLGSLAGGIAHDMNNVLAAILGLSSALRAKHAANHGLERNLGTIEQAATRGRDLVRGLLEFARQGLREPQLTDLNELVEREMEILRRTTLQRVDLVMELEPELPPVMGEPGSLAGALMNLCVNAVDAMPAGGTLRLRTRRVGSGVELSVEDTGEGMPPEVAARALEPFFTTKPTGKGTGLGLAMVYGTVKAHGGTLTLESQVGKGTRVRLGLPAELEARATVDRRAEARVAPEPAQHHLEVLLVDDDDVVRAAIPRLLEHLGHRVRTAARAEAALELLASGVAVDVMILDHNMPGLTGGAALPRLRALRPGLPIVVATGYRDAELDALLAPYPDVPILQKPFSLGELEAVLARALRGAPARTGGES
ncbi:MAG: PAS domain S-box protein [Myxococcales bacterium]|nr:PAS domain S-box protein [Myxococcales bacterium]